MSSEATLDIYSLQAKTTDLLEEIIKLMNRASKNLVIDDISENKYLQWQNEIEKELTRVTKLELRMAIAAPMNAGKSTIINAIIGEELLPHSVTAMTTLPTEIQFNNNINEPILKLTEGLIIAFQETVTAIKTQIENIGWIQIESITGEYSYLHSLLTDINTSENFNILPETKGAKETIKLLEKLNHIIRLCTILAIEKDPLQLIKDNDIPRIETPSFYLRKNQKSDTTGNLIIIDTPGPNEAGISAKLETVVAKQLQNSQLVLIVLDYTGLKAESAEKIKEEVQRVIRTRGEKNLYVLVNKIDQRKDESHMNTEEVKRFIKHNLELLNSDDEQRIFEISATQAFSSQNFRCYSENNSDNNDIKKTPIAKTLAKELWAVDTEEELEDISLEKLNKKAERLWNKSGFALFLEQAINSLMEEVAPRCIESALSLCKTRLQQLSESAEARLNYISSDAEKLKNAIKEIEKDIQEMKQCRSNLEKEVEITKKSLKFVIEKNLEDLKTNIKKKINEILYQDAINFVSNFFSNVFSLNNERGKFEFDNKEDAESFSYELKNSIERIIKEEIENITIEIEKHTQSKLNNLSNRLDDESNLIIEKAQDKLNKNFNMRFSTDTRMIIDSYFSVNNPDINYRFSDIFSNFLSILFDNFWIGLLAAITALIVFVFSIPFVKDIAQGINGVFKFFGFNNVIKIPKYVVEVPAFILEVNKFLDNNIGQIKREANDFIQNDFNEKIKIYFDALDDYLNQYETELKQSLHQQQLPFAEVENIKQQLRLFVNGEEKENIDFFIRDINILMEENSATRLR